MSPIILESPTPPSPSPAVGVDRESLILDGLDLNDGGTRTLVGLEFTLAKKLFEWLKGPDSDGQRLLRRPPHDNSEFDLKLLIRESTRDAVLDTIGGIIDKLQEAERQSAGGLGRGLPLVWSPMGTTYSYTFYVLAGESNLLRAEDFYKLGKPYVDLKLYCSPFGYGPEVSTATTTSSLPLITMTIEDVPGDVPGELRLTVTDAATQSRDYVAVGLENFGYDSGTALLTDSASFVTSGFAGSTTTRTGGYSSDGVVRATLSPSPVTVCSSAELTHLGTFRNLYRLWPSATDISVRMVWRQGRDQWTAEPWVTAPFEDNWWEVDLGQSKIREALLGTQTWQWRIEAKSGVAGATLDVDYHALIPSAEGYGKARRIFVYETPPAFSARDEFDQSAGALTGKTAPVGGVWAGAGDADDFAVETTGKTAWRAAPSDSGINTGRHAISGVAAMTAMTVSVDVKTSVLLPLSTFGAGQAVTARYVDVDNHLRARWTPGQSVGTRGLAVEKRLGGSTTTLLFADIPTPVAGTWYTLRLTVDAAGHWAVWYAPRGTSTSPFATGQDSDLATGGALASGKPGFYDFFLDASVVFIRSFDNFFAFIPTSDAAIYASQSLEFRSYGDDPALREDSTGTYWGRPAETRGGRLWLPPAGEEDRTTRVAVVARRNDIEGGPSANIADSTSVTAHYRPRWINIPRQA